MRGRTRCLPAAALAVWLAGCKGMFGGPALPDDPLFVSRKPLESKAEQGPPQPLARAEPTPPANPYFAESRSPLIAGASRPGRLTAPVPATPAARPAPGAPAPPP